MRPPLQLRTRQGWQRILEAGLEVLCDVGAERFTVSAVCDTAGVAATAVYARIDTRDELLAAVYEFGMTAVLESESALDESAVTGPDPRRAVSTLAAVFAEHRRFIGATVLGSAANTFFASRGAENVRRSRQRFVRAAVGADADARSIEIASTFFSAVFAVLVLDVGYGPEYTHATPREDPVTGLGEYFAELLDHRG